MLNLFAGQAKVSAANLQDFVRAAVECSAATGQGVEHVAKNFADLAGDPLKAVERLNESMHFLTVEIDEQIRSLQESGRQTEAANLAQKTYADALATRAPEVVANLGFVERAWRGITSAGSEAIDSVLAIGRTKTLVDQLRAAEQDYAKNFGEDDDPNAYRSVFNSSARAAARQRIADLQEQIRMQTAVARRAADTQLAEQRALALGQARSDYLQAGRTPDQRRDDEVAAEAKKWEQLSAGLQAGSAQYKALYSAHMERMFQISDKHATKTSSGGGGRATAAPADVFGSIEDLPAFAFQRAVAQQEKAYDDFLSQITGEADSRRTEQQVRWLAQAAAAGDITKQQFSDAMDRLAHKGKDTFNDLRRFGIEAASNVQDALGDGLYDLLSGRFDDIGKSWADTIVKMAAQAGAANLGYALFGDFGKSRQIGRLVGSLIGSLSGGSGRTDAQAFGLMYGIIVPSAKGNALSGGAGFDHYRNTIVNSPTLFRFAQGGAFGVMGEAGPEAVMPVKRGADDTLGVQGGATDDVQINITNNGQPMQISGQPRITRDDMGRMVVDVVTERITRHGKIATTLERRYGLR